MIATSGFHSTRDPDAPHASRAAPTADCICWRPIGDEASGPGAAQYPIYIRQRAVAALHDHYRASPQQGILGFLIGAMLEDPLTRERWLEIEFIVRLTQAIYGDKITLVISRVWERLQQEVGRTGGHMLGWYHTHPPLGVEIAPGDIEAHEQYFGRPWHVALVLGQNANGPLGAFYRPSAGLPLGATPLPFFEIVSRDSVTPEGRRRTRVTWKNYKPDLKRTTGAVTGLSAVLQALQTPAPTPGGPTPLPRMTTPPRGSAAIRATPPAALPAPASAPPPRATSAPTDVPLPPPPVPPPVRAPVAATPAPVASLAPERMRTPPRGSPAVRVPTPLPRRVPTPVPEPVAVVDAPPSAPAAPQPPVTVTFTPARVPVAPPPAPATPEPPVTGPLTPAPVLGPPPSGVPVATIAQPPEPAAPAPLAAGAAPAAPAPAADSSSAAAPVTFVPAPSARPRPALPAQAPPVEAEPLPPQLRESPPGPPPRRVPEPPAPEPPARVAPARQPPPAAATDPALDHLAAREKRPSAAVHAAIRVSSEAPAPPTPRPSQRRSFAVLQPETDREEASVARVPFVLALVAVLAGAVWWFVVRPTTAETPAASVPVQPAAVESTAAAVDSFLARDAAGAADRGAAPAAEVPSVSDDLTEFDSALDGVTTAIEAYRENARGWEDGERDCEALSAAYVAQSDRWLIYNRVRRPLSLDAARRARDQRALAAADSIDDHFRQSGCPRP